MLTKNIFSEIFSTNANIFVVQKYKLPINLFVKKHLKIQNSAKTIMFFEVQLFIMICLYLCTGHKRTPVEEVAHPVEPTWRRTSGETLGHHAEQRRQILYKNRKLGKKATNKYAGNAKKVIPEGKMATYFSINTRPSCRTKTTLI
jgi:hypothetical protein